MKSYNKFAITAAFTLLAGTAAAQDSLLDYVITACESDLEAYCSQVTPGEGRLLHCVAAHEDKISGQCGYALYQGAVLLEQLSAAIVYLAQSCAEELQTMCSEVEMGEGRVLACLEANQSALGDSCATALSDTAGS
ncbi:MAG: cysteine rich repeat-containing protein [Halieaceae bacterium]|jgi:hypothetical protein|nr:cysteine rich repeat-containing protein [Halieaceae bacterium]